MCSNARSRSGVKASSSMSSASVGASLMAAAISHTAGCIWLRNPAGQRDELVTACVLDRVVDTASSCFQSGAARSCQRWTTS